MASRWAFRFLLFYICVLCVQPQNRFTFLFPLHIADICIMGAVGLHFVSATQEGKPILRFGPATVIGLLLMFFSFISLHVGRLQTSSAWNSDIDVIFKNGLVMILVEAMAFNVKRAWAVQATLLCATMWWIKGGLRLAGAGATYSGDRIMGPAVSMIENPNGFAYLMTVMIPTYLYFFQKAPSKLARVSCLVCALAAVYIVLNTGSRTGLLALIAVGAFLLPKYGRQHKVAIGVAVVAIPMIMGTVGALNMERFRTIPDSIRNFLGKGEEKAFVDMTQDEQSSWERRQKNIDTWALIKDNFIFGVGVQPDDIQVWTMYGYAGGQVHNELLYAGKQMGIVGMSLYLGLLGTVFLRGRRTEKHLANYWPAMSDLGWTLKMQAVVFVVGGFFSPLSWNPIMMTLVGCASALWTNVSEKSYGWEESEAPASQTT
jgi:O-antigen ligase